MWNELKRAGRAFAFYISALLVIVGVYGAVAHFGLAEIGAKASLQVTGTKALEKTRLETVVANAREIRAALAKPVAGVEPLGPIKTRAANALGGPKAVTEVAIKKPKRKPLSDEAMNAFASSTMGMRHDYVAYDRHRPL